MKHSLTTGTIGTQLMMMISLYIEQIDKRNKITKLHLIFFFFLLIRPLIITDISPKAKKAFLQLFVNARQLFVLLLYEYRSLKQVELFKNVLQILKQQPS